MVKKLQTIFPSLAALFWGGVIVSLYASRQLGTILAPRFHTITLLGGLGMIVIGLFVLLTMKEKSDCGHDHCEHDHDHHEQNPFMVLLLMIVPLAATLAADTSNGYSLDLLERKGLYNSQIDSSAYALPPYTREMLEQSTPKSEEGRYQIPLSQIYFSSGDKTMKEVFNSIEVEFEGQVIAEQTGKGNENRLRIYRTLMTCCAADAIVMAFPIEFENQPPTFASRAWVRVGGTLLYEKVDGGEQPILQVKAIESIPAPNFGGYPGW